MMIVVTIVMKLIAIAPSRGDLTFLAVMGESFQHCSAAMETMTATTIVTKSAVPTSRA